MFPAGEFPVTKTANLWSTNHGKKELLKWFAQVPVVPIYFTLEIVGYFIFFQNQWHLTCKITIKFF
jgi:hypothetical protein